MTVLARDISAAETVIGLTGDCSWVQPGQTFVIDNELVVLLAFEDVPPLVGQTRAVGLDRNSWIIRRGALETPATSHSAGATVAKARPAFSKSTDLSAAPTPVATTSGNAAHPDLAAHDALGLATDAELAAHVAAPDPHVLYALDADLVNAQAFPVGSLFLSVVATDPSSLLGYGTWSQVAQGRFLVGQDGATYASGAATGGAGTHGHTVTQPSAHAAVTHSGATVADHAALAHSAHAGATVGNHAVTQASAHSDHGVQSHSAHAGSAVAAHTFTQPTGHSAHVVTQPANHVFTQSAGHSNHVFTQPAAHSNHAVTQPAAHTFTQPAGHSAHVVTQPSAHADVLNHVHLENLQGGTTGTTTGTHLMGSAATGGSLRAAGQSTANPTSGGVASQAHSGAAVDAHSAHSGGAVDAHSATAVDAHSAHASGAVDAHSAHSGAAVDAHTATAVDAHSAHSGGAVDAHSVTQPNAHSDHAALSHGSHSGTGVDAHTVGQPSAHSDHALQSHTVGQASQHAAQSHAGAAVDTVSNVPPYFAAYIWQRTA